LDKPVTPVLPRRTAGIAKRSDSLPLPNDRFRKVRNPTMGRHAVQMLETKTSWLFGAGIATAKRDDPDRFLSEAS
jgi:hypothetical protein